MIELIQNQLLSYDIQSLIVSLMVLDLYELDHQNACILMILIINK